VEDVYFYAFMILTSDDFNCFGKALPKGAQMDTRSIDENETLEDRVAKSWQKERKELRPGSGREQKKQYGRKWVMLQMVCLELHQTLAAALHLLAPL
jgi:hypothetical protein